MRLKFKTFSQKQLQVLSWWCNNSKSKSKDAIICDGAIRSGKTICMGMSFMMWAFARFNKKSFAICGKTIRSIKRNLIIPLLPTLDGLGFKCKLKISENILEVTLKGNTNIFYLFGGKDESSASLIQGMTLCGVFFDEVALMPKSFVEQALARCSVAGSKFWFNCNPEHPQHWFYKEWIENKKNKNLLYIHFTMDDNPSVTEEIRNRYEKLYNGVFYERFIKGRWVVTQGLIYPDMANKESFCSTPFVNFGKYMVSCDYGTVNPTSIGLWAKYENVWYRINEYYFDSRKEGYQKTDLEHYESLCALTEGIKVDKVTVDPSAASFIALIRKEGKFIVVPAKNDVVDGIRQVSTSLKNGDIKICSTCKNSIREFSLYRWEDSLSKDIPIKENDHAMDDIRYFVSTLMGSAEDDFFAIAMNR